MHNINLKPSTPTLMPIVYLFLLCLHAFLSCTARHAPEASANSEQSLSERQQALQKLLAEQSKLTQSIDELKASLPQAAKIPSVRTRRIIPQSFQHFIDLQAVVESEQSMVVMPSLGPGKVAQILVKLGERVSKGQALLRLEDTLISSQIQTLETRLNFAQELYRKQAGLWEQKIGSEIEVLQRKNEVEALEGQLETLRRNRELSVITAPIAGVIDALDLSVGDIFAGYAGNQAQLRIVNLSQLKAAIAVPDLYVQDLQVGSMVEIAFADIGLKFSSHIRNLAQYIDRFTRSFTAYAPIPSNSRLKINLVGTAKILDYANSHSKVLPIDLIYSDKQGKYVILLQAEADAGLYTLTKRYVVLGKSYRNEVEIRGGLDFGDLVLADNLPELSPGLQVRTDS